jgi:hypothetical protein
MDETIDDTNIVEILTEEYVHCNEYVNDKVEKLVMTKVKAMNYGDNIVYSLSKLRSHNPSMVIPRVLTNIFDIKLICKYDSIDWLRHYYEKYMDFQSSSNGPQLLHNDNGKIHIIHYLLKDMTNVACEHDAILCLQFMANNKLKLNMDGLIYCIKNDSISCLSIFLDNLFELPKYIMDVVIISRSLLCLQFLLINGYNITLRIIYDLIEKNDVQILQMLRDHGYRYDDYHLYHSMLCEAEHSESYFISLNIVTNDITSMTYDMKQKSLDNDLFIK